MRSGTRHALEHGGAAPVIVGAAGLDDIQVDLTKGGLCYAGQVRVSVQRVFAHASMARDVAEGIAGLATKPVIGDPTGPETEVGPLIGHAKVGRVAERIKEAADGGAERIAGGDKISDSCHSPTVLHDPPGDDRSAPRRFSAPWSVSTRSTISTTP